MVFDSTSLGVDEGEFDERLILRFERNVHRLVRLRHLTWEILVEYDEASTIFQEFEYCCPQLQSVTLWAPIGACGPGYDVQVFCFTNLSHVEIMFPTMSQEGQCAIASGSMRDMMRASPALVNLTLLFTEVTSSSSRQEDWLLDVLTENLDQTFFQLRELRITGKCIVIDWHKMLDQSSNKNHTRSFFLRHPHIQTLEIDCKPLSDISISPNSAQILFPSVRHFYGPDFICTALVASDVCLQLESLEAKDIRSDIDSTPSVAGAVKSLPKLRELRCPAQSSLLHPQVTELISVEALQKILFSAPEIEKLVISSGKYFKSVPNEFVNIFQAAPNLCEITLPLQVDTSIGGESVDCWDLAYKLGRKCPRLDTIISSVPGDPGPGGQWRIVRAHDGSVSEVRGLRAGHPEELHVLWM
ncbi:hypothetical protein BDV93DRAFT_608188 [Ceratobasidium sp. AG-I]|nr:hypothetical protein BDV93DRAFT_608188 [Ceratobasidium sp. AG-I]